MFLKCLFSSQWFLVDIRVIYKQERGKNCNPSLHKLRILCLLFFEQEYAQPLHEGLMYTFI